MNNKTAVVLGSTGLIGNELVKELLIHQGFSKIKLLVRRPVEINHQKAEVVIVDFDNINDLTVKTGNGDCVFCCIGTTLAIVKGNKTAYRKIDYDIIVNAARISAAAGFRQFILVSAVGANAKSSNFYLRLKGEIERDISLLSFESVHIFRPSILLGKRKQFRLAEKLGQEFMNIFSFLLIGPLTKYKGVYARDIAKAMVIVANAPAAGVHVYEYDQIANILSDENIRS